MDSLAKYDGLNRQLLKPEPKRIPHHLAQLAVALRKIRMDPSRCALGARVASMMKILGLEEEEFHQFMSDIYRDCTALGIKRDKIPYCLRQLHDLCESVPFSEIPDHIAQQVTRKRELEQQLRELEARVVDAKNRVDKALKAEGITLHDLNFKRELWKRETYMDEISQFLEALEVIRQYAFDPATVISRYRNFLKRDAGNIAVDELRKELATLQEQVDVHRQVISKYEELKRNDFGLKELKQLANTVKEIAEANDISTPFAVQKFLADIEEQYDNKLGFELKLKSLKSDIENYEHRRATIDNQSCRSEFWAPFASPRGGEAPQGEQPQQQTNSKVAEGAGYGTITPDVLENSARDTNASTTADLNTKRNNFGHKPPGKEAKIPDQERHELRGSTKQIKRDTSDQFREIGNAASMASQRKDSPEGFFGSSTGSGSAFSDDLDTATTSAPDITNTSNATNKNLPRESLDQATKEVKEQVRGDNDDELAEALIRSALHLARAAQFIKNNSNKGRVQAKPS
ncbi:MAG: hypothetical protein M3P08_09595 [Thermoproteota archaeon]|nr:hypothetical protein [Thermoproteota archaeon]